MEPAEINDWAINDWGIQAIKSAQIKFFA